MCVIHGINDGDAGLLHAGGIKAGAGGDGWMTQQLLRHAGLGGAGGLCRRCGFLGGYGLGRLS